MRIRFLTLLAVLVFAFAACGGAVSVAPSPSPSASAAPYPLTVTDDRGKALTLKATPTRIVSFAPSATEIVFALGAGDRIVATDDFSDFPAEARTLPKLGGTRTSPEKIVALTPDLILAISSGNLPAQLDSIITICGGINVGADAPTKFPTFGAEQIVARAPDIVVLADFRFGATPEQVTSRPGWASIPAVRNRAIYPIDDDLVSRPGPRLVLGVEAYARIIHPELFGRP